jgi:hypothetical protein
MTLLSHVGRPRRGASEFQCSNSVFLRAMLFFLLPIASLAVIKRATADKP